MNLRLRRAACLRHTPGIYGDGRRAIAAISEYLDQESNLDLLLRREP